MKGWLQQHLSVCQQLPNAKKFQTQSPLAPYLFDIKLHNCYITLVKRFVKKLILDKAESVVQLMNVGITSKDSGWWSGCN